MVPFRQEAIRGLTRALGSRRAPKMQASESSTQGSSSDQAALVIEAALFEYSLLRDEILHIRARQSQLVVFIGAGVGALISSTQDPRNRFRLR